MKKKLTLVLTALLMLTLTVFAFTAYQISTGGCGYGSHTHVYESLVVAPTCSEKGYTRYYCNCGDEYTSDYTLPTYVHTYGEVRYQWSSNYNTCSANVTCKNCDNEISETDYLTKKQVTQEATCTLDELTTYTVTFKNELFGTHIENVKTANKLGHDYAAPTYVWSSDNSTCTATHVCTRDGSHKETETVNSTSTIAQNKTCMLDELTTYTATFENSVFSTQTKENVNTANKLGHDFDLETDLCTRCSAVYFTKGLEYELVTTSTESYYQVIGIGTSTGRKLVIPSIHNKLPVKTIADNAFKNCTRLTIIVVPDSVTSIGEGAFYNCSGLTSITIPNSVTSIGEDAFRNCSGLESITIPDSVTSIGEDAFLNCSKLTSITIPDSVTSIGDSAFWNCSGLKSITIPNSVTSIGDSAFYGCSNLQYNEYDNAYYLGNNNNPYVVLVKAKNTSITSCTINDRSKFIHRTAFSGCSGLTSITIPDSVTSIGSSAFSGCSSLESITLPFIGNRTGVTKNDTYQYPFGYIFGTSSYTGGTKTEQYYYGNSTSSTTSSYYYIPTSLKTVTITVGNILYGAFWNCSGLKSITIPNSVTSIGDRAFWNCSGLTSVTIGNSVTSIGSYAFSGCSNLQYNEYDNSYYLGNNNNPYVVLVKAKNTSITSCTINDRTKFIHSNAFYNCSKLTSVTIPDSVTSIGYRAFYGCYKLVEVINKSQLNITKGSDSNGYVAYYALNVKTEGTSDIVNVNDYLFYTYDNVNYLLGYVGNDTELVLPDNYNGQNYEIYEYAFYNCSGLTSITIPDSVTSIGYDAFYGCYKLVEVINKSQLNITKGSDSNGYVAYYALNVKTEGTSDIVNVNDYLFYTYDNVNYLLGYVGNDTELVLPDNYNGQNYEIYEYAFYNCRNLTSIIIPDSVTSIGSYAFLNCSGLKGVSISDIAAWCNIEFDWYSNPLTYAHNLYLNNVLVTDLVIPNTVSTIKGYAFNGASCLQSITIPDSVISIGTSAFEDCSGLTSITIPDSVTSIGTSAFEDCSGLTSVTIGNSVTSIGDYAFWDCSGLTSVTIGNSVTSIGCGAFNGCSGLTSITIPDSVTSIGYDAFNGCSGLTRIDFNGTKAQWNAINKGSDWKDNTGSFTVYCTDGTISKSNA